MDFEIRRVPKPLLVFAVFLVAVASASGQQRSYGRSMVVTPYGIVATTYVQASQAGARILEQGGSAIDAGIAANAVLGVDERIVQRRWQAARIRIYQRMEGRIPGL